MTPEERLGRVLGERGLTLAVAESCTGGLISARITDVAGASAYFLAGLVTYSNGAKERMLSVPPDLLGAKGAVSPEVARAMARGVRAVAGADLGLSITGIAGPGGGTEAKPVGTVYMALSAGTDCLVRHYRLEGDRASVRRKAVGEALSLVLDYLEGRL